MKCCATSELGACALQHLAACEACCGVAASLCRRLLGGVSAEATKALQPPPFTQAHRK